MSDTPSDNLSLPLLLMPNFNNKGPCKFFNSPQGCHSGNRCKYRHDVSPQSGNNSPVESSQRRRLGIATPRGPTIVPPGLPRNACRLFWQQGSCNHGFECTFHHMRPSQATSKTPLVDTADVDDPPDFFSVEGMIATTGIHAEQLHSMSPGEAHNHIKPFLKDTYHFDSAARVQGFVKIIASINDRNKAWNSDSAQSFLDLIVKGDGIIRIGEVLRFKPVSEHASLTRLALSFQTGYFPILDYLSSTLVLKSAWQKNINLLYTVIEDNFDDINDVLRTCVGNMINNKSWKDRNGSTSISLDGALVFQTLSTVLLEYISRFKSAIRNHPELVRLVTSLVVWFDTWAQDVSNTNSIFKDKITCTVPSTRRLLLDRLRERIDRLNTIIQRETENDVKLRKSIVPSTSMTANQRKQASTLQFTQTYDPPGDLRPEGKRHDNDHVEISRIRIAPTHDELLSDVSPYLPLFRPEAPHHFEENSMERHLDIQFRLLREESMSPIRSSIAAIHDGLTKMWQSNLTTDSNHQTKRASDLTTLEDVLVERGGAYRTSGFDSLFFFIYTNVEFAPVKAERRDLTVGLTLDTPPGAARDPDTTKRYAYWKNGRRLGGGSLIALIIVSQNQLEVYLGAIASGSDDSIAESSKASPDRIQIRVSFFDHIMELRALKREKICGGNGSYAFLVDNSVMFEACRPFLESLQTIEPTMIPFARYIAHTSSSLEDIRVLPPRYTTSPQFKFKIGSLFTGGRKPVDFLDVRNPSAVEEARQHLIRQNCLDPSQVDAVINTLTREVSLIQGPPGTGKSYIGRKILDVLIKSRIKPIILIAFTNHALDHMLTSVLDEKITKKIVRLGSRSSDERISEYSLNNLERVAQKGELRRSIGKIFAEMKRTEENICDVMESIQLPVISASQINDLLQIHYPEHAGSLFTPPFWIQELCQKLWAEEDENGEWTKVKGKGKQKSATANSGLSRTWYGVWKDASDIAFITPRTTANTKQETRRGKKKQKSTPNTEITFLEVEDSEVTQFFSDLGFGNDRPSFPNGDRQISFLVNNYVVWSMSAIERRRLAEMWEGEIRKLAYESHLQTYNDLRKRYKGICREYNDLKDENRRRLLSTVDLIGCTTTGAAKLTSLLTSIEPRVIMVEEAGQVLEAHVLTSLVPSVQHLICIGDPQQLRPTLATFSLSMDNAQGKELFKFDRSLMERLADGGLPMTQINVQRRMRPTISHFIRKILYPKLEDHHDVTKYPQVQGMSKDVYFLSHTNPESGSEDSVSKCNAFEVKMIRDLVLYFLKQGTYNGPGDIAVLCAYLGQLQKVRQALKDLKISVSVDERDQEQLVKQGMEEDTSTAFEEVMVAEHIRLGTVDIFQGQEAKIVIVSLVRNTGNSDTKSASIGFLKSSNRINVALSRAKHGLYILGNAPNLRKNSIWSTIIDELQAADQIGPGFPIRCVRHPGEVRTVSKPGELRAYAPEGGCLLPCGSQLPCGHVCPSVCHAVLDGHKSTYCHERCNRTPCSRNHPCERKCSEDCGGCLFPFYNVTLPCEHVAVKIPCHMSDKLGDVKCGKMIEKKLPRCEHTAVIPCSQNPASITCKVICGESMQCCTKPCKSQCGDCQKETAGLNIMNETNQIQRTVHKQHPCERNLYCMHSCGQDCHPKEVSCNHSCQKSCRQVCKHQKCNKPCSVPCPPCMEPCSWRCEHAECSVTCGSICIRLPCDEPCRKTLPCGHPCHSVCGEICDSQACLQCLPSEKKQDICDFILQRRLEDLDMNSEGTSERIITLECGHIFTVETLDGHCDMSSYYEMDTMGRFIFTKVPPTGYQTPPVCPTCRGPISALRYGRITKRATLDILEQNVANTMSRSLQDVQGPFETLSSLIDDKKTEAAKIKGDPSNTKFPSRGRAEESIQKMTAPLSYKILTRAAMHSLHGISPMEGEAWDQIVKDLVNLYRQIENIACTRGAHVKAYEGALSTLYRSELDAATNDPSQDSEIVQPLAFKHALEKMAPLWPKADVRYQIEAYFYLLKLRFMLSQISLSRIEGLAALNLNEEKKAHRQLWISFVELVYTSCIADSKKALIMAQASSAPRQAARCSAYIVRSKFEYFRFRTLVDLSVLTLLDTEERKIILDSIVAKKTELLVNVEERRKEYIRIRPAGNFNAPQDERKWFDENCAESVHRFIDDLEELKEFAKRGGKYQPVSLQEKQDVLNALGFVTTGHFYKCPNGHPFVITECGGATQTSKCPECGAEIGGNGHRLLESNSQDTELEEMLRNQGTRPGYVDHPDFGGNIF